MASTQFQRGFNIASKWFQSCSVASLSRPQRWPRPIQKPKPARSIKICPRASVHCDMDTYVSYAPRSGCHLLMASFRFFASGIARLRGRVNERHHNLAPSIWVALEKTFVIISKLRLFGHGPSVSPNCVAAILVEQLGVMSLVHWRLVLTLLAEEASRVALLDRQYYRWTPPRSACHRRVTITTLLATRRLCLLRGSRRRPAANVPR